MGFLDDKKGPATVDWPSRLAELGSQSCDAALRAFYERSCPSGATALGDVPLAALDLETTGLDPERHGIVSVGIVPFDLERIRCSAGFYHVVRPRRELEERSVTIHRLTHEEVEAAPDLAEIAEALLDALAGRVAVVHFHAIERRFLYQAFLRRFGEGLLFPLIDTLHIEKQLNERPGLNPLKWFGRKRESLRLADARRRYNLPEYEPHHAWTDALATAELFQAQVAHHGSDADRLATWWL